MVDSKKHKHAGPMAGKKADRGGLNSKDFRRVQRDANLTPKAKALQARQKARSNAQRAQSPAAAQTPPPQKRIDGVSGPFVLHHVVYRPATARAAAAAAADALGPLCHVWLHGMTSGARTFADVMRPVADASGLPVVALDLRGHGASPEPAAPTAYTPAAMAADVKATLDSLGIARCHLLGHSYGARVAFQFAADYAPRVATLVIEDAFAAADRSGGPALDAAAFAARAAAMRAQYAGSFATRAAAAAFFERVAGPARSHGFDSYDRNVGGPDAAGLFHPLYRPHAAYAWAEHARLADMSGVWLDPARHAFPVHLMCGGGPGCAITATRFRALSADAAAMSGATVLGRPLRTARRVDGSGHSIHRTHPEAFVADLLDATRASA
jgi:pimeloyl-ACP methyl ester carboxylesterase